MLLYDFLKIESKWQDHWETQQTFKTVVDFSKKKFYCLDMFPYPSAEGLHIGHIEGYTASDIINRFKRMEGYNVLHPFGWDSFGLPAEQYALTTGKNPQQFTYENIGKFKKQIQRLGKGVDWTKELATSDPSFYKWTQWIFKKLYENKLAVLENVEVNFCPQLGTVLANEEVIQTEEGLFSERGNFPVIKKEMKQWVLKITAYIDRLLEDLQILNWPNRLKEIQKNWIGKKEGFILRFPLKKDTKTTISVFTTEPHTVFGINAIILAPENPLAPNIVTPDNNEKFHTYILQTQQKTNLNRFISKKKTGFFTGNYVISPFTNQSIPIWIADYVLPHYGTGAIMSVPGKDSRDLIFSQTNHLAIPQILSDGILINSSFLNNLKEEKALLQIIKYITDKNIGEIHCTYQIRDWVFSRQRYWGEPFCLFYDEENNIYLEKDEDLPLRLPFIDKLEISGDGTSPLSKISSWLYFEKNGKKYKRDSNTMPQMAGSSWYYIGYILKRLTDITPLNSPEAKKLLEYFLPVDVYIGGSEHAVGHLLYARFWHKFLYDLNLVSSPEPFIKLVNQGMILGEDNLKMSKSKGNSVNASLMLTKYGADVLRLYIMFLGPLEDTKKWSESNIKGIQRFLNKVYNTAISYVISEPYDVLNSLLNDTIRKVTFEYENFKFNTAISHLMIFVNQVIQHKKINKTQMKIFLQLLNPIAPHITEELNQTFLKSNIELAYTSWPVAECTDSLIESQKIIVQINGKLKGLIDVRFNSSQEQIVEQAMKIPKINTLLMKKKIIKIIYLPCKLLNLVVA
ncbi:leucine--tRNA ligase [Candidatus Phytoplasma phoenicium]|uniref:Leucine--tRNA ligase n=1 Tax=Candidatus Phytoplasma phoenicium TaxID=198422 RepID=A0A0L0MKA4_9MOLU|nr:leucine--tRNA ligase [Candidatus Phytoplasma phoenicium]KND62696.1 Leucyl-tRNA synthetase [Candidatus Phytoplasma phoenicium]